MEARNELNKVIESGGSDAAIEKLQEQVEQIEKWNTDIEKFLTEQVTKPIHELQNDMTDEEEGYVPRSLQELEKRLKDSIRKIEEERQRSDLAKQMEEEVKALRDGEIIDEKIRQQIQAVEAKEAARRQEEFQALSAQVKEDAKKLAEYEARLKRLSGLVKSLSNEIQALTSSKKPEEVQRDSILALMTPEEREAELEGAAAAAKRNSDGQGD